MLPLLLLREADHRLSADQPTPAFVSFQFGTERRAAKPT